MFNNDYIEETNEPIEIIIKTEKAICILGKTETHQTGYNINT